MQKINVKGHCVQTVELKHADAQMNGQIKSTALSASVMQSLKAHTDTSWLYEVAAGLFTMHNTQQLTSTLSCINGLLASWQLSIYNIQNNQQQNIIIVMSCP